MKKRVAELFIILLVAAMSLSVGFIGYFLVAHGNFEKGVTVAVNGTTLSTLNPDLSGLAPGKSTEYDVNLLCEAEGNYAVTLDFVEGSQNELSQYIDVSLSYGETNLNNSLTSLLGEDVFTFNCYLTSSENAVVTLHFTIPSTVGNEAQGATANFSIEVKIEKI